MEANGSIRFPVNMLNKVVVMVVKSRGLGAYYVGPFHRKLFRSPRNRALKAYCILCNFNENFHGVEVIPGAIALTESCMFF